jgi:N-acetylglutamate synthase-like GNAT family acetyltransferase
MQFSIINKEDKDFEETVKEANTVWRQKEAFGNEYGEGECPGDSLAIGSFDGKTVCSAIIETWGNAALVSCMGAYPQKRGYGSSLVRHIVKHLEDSGVIKIYLKIDRDDKTDRLETFYSQYGFIKVDKVDEDDEVFVDCDTDEEYVMSRSGSVNSV